MWREEMNRHFLNGDTQMVNRHMKNYLSSLIVREMQIRMTNDLTPIRTVNTKKSGSNKCNNTDVV